MALDDRDFEIELQQQMGDHLGAVSLEGKRGAYPLVQQIAQSHHR